MFYRLWNRRKREAELEPPPVGNRDRQFRGLFAGVPMIVGLVTLSILALLTFFHIRFMAQVGECRNNSMTNANMEVIAEQAPYFLQPEGSLSTELYSPDPPQQVEASLNRARAAIMREAVVSGDFRNLPTMLWEVAAADEGGSHIILYCP
jgi:hypothetical protein